MNHDPMCPIQTLPCPGHDRPHDTYTATDDRGVTETWCGSCQTLCQCDLIAKVRADERERSVTRQ